MSPRGRRVTERAQEMFLEYAHYLPERATLKVVQKVQDMVASELDSLDLRTPMDADAVIEHLSHVHSGSFLTLALLTLRWLEWILRGSISHPGNPQKQMQ